MAWYNPLSWNEDNKQKVIETSIENKDSLLKAAKKLGLNVTIDDDTGAIISLPHNIEPPSRSEDMGSFFDWWLETTLHQDSHGFTDFGARLKNYKLFDLMDDNISEVSLTLDTYADEAISVGFVDEPIQIEVNDEKAQKDLLDILEKNKIIARARGSIRSLAKFGDYGYYVDYLDSEEKQLGVKIIKPHYFESFVDHDTHRVFAYKLYAGFTKDDEENPHNDPTRPINRKGIRKKSKDRKHFHKGKHHNHTHRNSYGSDHGHGQDFEVVSPLEFVQVSLSDEDMFPYGRSILHGMRSAFDQLSTLEALLALSRASKVERLIIRVPVATDDPASAFSKLAQVKNMFKSLIFQNGANGKKSTGKQHGLTEQLWLPSGDGFDISTLKSSIDISNTDDVEFFLEKGLRATRLPKGFLFGEEVTDRGKALQAQDLKFARVLIPVQDSYLDGLTMLSLIILAHLGYDISQIKVDVSIERPPQLSNELITSYSDTVRLAGDMIDQWKRAMEDPDERTQPKFPAERYIALLKELGLPEDIARQFTSPDISISGDIDDPADLSEDKVTHISKGKRKTYRSDNLIKTNPELFGNIREKVRHLKENKNEEKSKLLRKIKYYG